MSRFQKGILVSIGLLGAILLIVSGWMIRRPQESSSSRHSTVFEQPTSPKGLPQGLIERNESGMTRIPVLGYLRNSTGDGVEGANVEAVTFIGQALRGGKTKTTGDGYFELNLVPGTYSLHAQLEGVGAVVQEPFLVRDGGKGPPPIELILHPDLEVPFLILEEGSGRPISGLQVSIRRFYRSSDRSRYSVIVGEWSSDENGRVSIVGLSQGEYQVHFSGVGFNVHSQFFQIKNGSCSRPLPWKVVMQGNTFRAIFQVMGEKGEPLPLVKASIVFPKDSREFYSNPRGMVTLDHLPPASFRVDFSLKGYDTHQVSFQLDSRGQGITFPYMVKLKRSNGSE
ncbi:MAG: carboxypeptidase-like regulatory domain-containing protein [Planctomycetota bacterium]|jgi:hypothetical protein|nr:carboxypeptidase-like regulatory domain-containing protein [Planctomycetota bacterium]